MAAHPGYSDESPTGSNRRDAHPPPKIPIVLVIVLAARYRALTVVLEKARRGARTDVHEMLRRGLLP